MRDDHHRGAEAWSVAEKGNGLTQRRGARVSDAERDEKRRSLTIERTEDTERTREKRVFLSLSW
jgi:hypothetical protein